jgi:anti-anti-sigma regulatory factor
MSDQPKPRIPRRSPSSQSIPIVSSPPPVAPRGTQHTKLRGDGRSVQTIFKGKLDEHLIQSAGTSAIGYLNGSELFWIIDLLSVPGYDGAVHMALGKQLEAFKAAGGHSVIAAISETMERYRIFRASLSSLGLRHRVDIHHATNSDDLAKLISEQLLRR